MRRPHKGVSPLVDQAERAIRWWRWCGEEKRQVSAEARNKLVPPSGEVQATRGVPRVQQHLQNFQVKSFRV